MNADCKTAFGAIEERLPGRQNNVQPSLAATPGLPHRMMARVWIFGYGSLIWNPALNYRESCTGTAAGLAPRVLPAVRPPGAVVPASRDACWPLKEGGRTTGVAYRLPDDTLEEELTLLRAGDDDHRLPSAHPGASWSRIDGRTVNALAFIMDPRHPLCLKP